MRALLVGVVLLLAGCSKFQDGPSIGSGTDDYKKSPCACAEVVPSYRRQYQS